VCTVKPADKALTTKIGHIKKRNPGTIILKAPYSNMVGLDTVGAFNFLNLMGFKLRLIDTFFLFANFSKMLNFLNKGIQNLQY
jgi:hypothetical protein